MMGLDRHLRGLLWAALGVAGFSLTFPATRFAVQFFPVEWVATGRGTLAGIVAGGVLLARRVHAPASRYWGPLALVAFCTVVAFPWLIAQALRTQSAASAGVLAGGIPVLTAVVAWLRGRERLTTGFWFAAVAGAAGVTLYGVLQGQAGSGGLVYFLMAMICAAVGYAEGGRLAAEIGGMSVVSWSVVLALPFIAPTAIEAYASVPRAPLEAWLAFLYLGLVSQWLAFAPWYRGMTLAGIARASQIQQLQVFLTLIVSALWLGEPAGWQDALFAAWVVSCVALAQYAARHGGKAALAARTNRSTTAAATLD